MFVLKKNQVSRKINFEKKINHSLPFFSDHEWTTKVI